MRDALKSYLALASGVTDLTRQRAVAAARALVSQGEATAEQVTGLAEDLLAQTRQNREAVVALVAFEVDRALGRVGLATADEVGQLTGRIRELEQELRALTVTQGAGSASKAPVTKAAPVEKAPVKKAPVKRAPVKRAPVKAAPVKRVPVKAAPVKRAPVKAAPVKKAPAKAAPVEKLPPQGAAPAGGS